MSDVLIRTASVSDALAVESVRVAVWKTAYRGMLPDAFLDAMVVDAAMRAETMARSDVTNLLATLSGAPVGMAAFGPCRDEDRFGEKELYALYVLTQRRGVGQSLLEACGPVTSLWVLRDNLAAQAFYERHGFARDGSTSERVLGGAAVVEVRMLRHLG